MTTEKKIAIFSSLGFLIIIATFLFVSQKNTFNLVSSTAYNIVSNVTNISTTKKLKNPPHPIKGIYISAWSTTNSKKIDDLIQLVKETELNGVVLDVKDATGFFTYTVNIPLAQKIGANNEIKLRNIDNLINKFHKENIYVIGRVQVFQDPVLAAGRPDIAIKNVKTGETWKDNKGLAWIDPSSRIAWQYAVDIAKDMAMHGFDEVNFDYVRFPADGNIEVVDYPFWNAVRPKYELIGSFFAYLDQELKDVDIATSADIFGLAAWRAMDFNFDLNIGQRLIDALPYFDYVSPMIYPSHYPDNFNGIKKPASKPYEIIHGSLATWQDLKATTSYKANLRPWLQDFDLGGIKYDATKVRAQIQATYDTGVDSWLLWNSSNRYTRDALLAE
ncbi:MAG: putative glycoside hydrolase [bacterium]|nr:putative glycoside hydrolase [bacterium]